MVISLKDNKWFCINSGLFNRNNVTSVNKEISEKPIFFKRKLFVIYFIKTLKFHKLGFQLQDYPKFEKIISESIFNGFSEQFSEQGLLNQFSKLIYPKIIFYREILKRVKPKTAYVLCYYCNSTQPFLIAAKLEGIKVIEMQHGVQSSLHLAYGNWTNIPEKGYINFPDVVYNWDENSSQIISQYMGKDKNVATKIIGNPWIKYCENLPNDLPKGYILYTLQPTLSYEDSFPDTIINFIKNNDIEWFVRLHPRQLNDIELFKNFLEEKDLLDKVKLDKADSEPLPLLIANCKLHITHSSSVALEAKILNKKSVLFSEIGRDYYPEIIAEKSAFYLPLDNDFEHNLLKILKNDS